MVEPVKYKPENVVEVKPGDAIPEKSIVFHKDGHQWMPACEIIASHNVTHYAPAPILDLPPEPKEVEFGEAMERIRDGEELLWELEDMREVVGQDRRVLCFMRSPSSYPINNFGELGDGRFYEIPYPSKPQPKTTGLKWWEAIEATRETRKRIRYVGAREDQEDLNARWNQFGLLVDLDGNEFAISTDDLDAEWEIVE